jgi:hypothetical protein
MYLRYFPKKLLKSPNSPHTVGAILIDAGLVAIIVE